MTQDEIDKKVKTALCGINMKYLEEGKGSIPEELGALGEHYTKMILTLKDIADKDGLDVRDLLLGIGVNLVGFATQGLPEEAIAQLLVNFCYEVKQYHEATNKMLLDKIGEEFNKFMGNKK